MTNAAAWELPGPVLLYDDNCGFCAASVRFILNHERQHSLLFAPLEGSLGTRVRARHPELADIDSMMWVDPSGSGAPRVLVRSAAALRVARYLGGPWRLAVVARLVPSRLRDWGYDWVARHRHGLAGAGARCFLPSAELRSRFLD